MKPGSRILAIGWLLAMAACGGGDSFIVEIVFPDDEAKDAARSVKVLAIMPGQSASCEALQAGDARPGEIGYVVEDEVTFDIPVESEPRPLEVLEPGRRLFYAEAADENDIVFVRGCTEAEAGGKGIDMVTIELDPIEQPCLVDEDCDDDNQCTDDTCEDGECHYENSEQDSECDDGSYCTVNDVCDGSGNCEGSDRDCSSLDDQCLHGICDEDADSCTTEPANEGQNCNDGVYCTSGETCQAGVCTGGGDTDCDDGVACTLDSCDTEEDECSNVADDTLCDDGAACTTDTCDPVDGCQHTPNTGGCPEYHIGPAADTCPHQDAEGAETSVCDFEGATGLTEAATAAPPEGAMFFLYDNLGSVTEFTACEVDIPANSLVTVGPGIDPGNVFIACHWEDSGASNGVLHLAGDNIHLAWLNIINMADSNTAVSAWPTSSDPVDASGGHLIENIVGFAVHEEYLGNNSLQEPLQLGPDTTVRNCYLRGYYENEWELTEANNTRFLNNTFVFYQNAGTPFIGDPPDDPPADSIQGTQGILFANNVFLSLTCQEDHMLLGDMTTTGLTLVGNVIEGYQDLVIDLDPDNQNNVIEDNVLGEAQLESPLAPFFLADADQVASALVAGEGVSLDGVEIQGRTDILPGAYQQRSVLSGPRRMTVMVGDGNCDGPCDIGVDEDNEVQKAVWSSWPGGVVELYPFDSYAGNAVIAWGVTIQGMGNEPEDVVLYNTEEDPILTFYSTYFRHESVLTALHRMDMPVHMDKFMIMVDADETADEHAVLIEGSGYTAPPDWHTLTRLRIGTITGSTPGLFWALYLGDMVRVQDVLIHGAWQSCIRCGVRRSDSYATPTTSPRVINTTCRLNGTGTYLPVAALDIASVENAFFVNLAIELETDGALFQAQRRASGDTDPVALDAPDSYILHSVSQRGCTIHSEGFDPVVGSHDETALDEILTGDPYFQNADNSHLANGCTARDSGVDPADVNEVLEAGVSLDGVDRSTVDDIDRGCYEQ